MPKVIIMNQGTGHEKGYDSKRSDPLRKSVGRCVWLAAAGDIIISPIPIENSFLLYVSEVLGFDAGSVSVMVMDHLRAEGLSISGDDVQRIKSRLDKNREWTVMPCFWTPDVAQFAKRLGLGDSTTLAFASQRGPDLFNRKTHFRQFAAGASIPIPEGSVVTSKRSLEEAIKQHLVKTGTVIIKKDDSAGGLGNITITTGAVEILPGSRETFSIEDPKARATAVWESLIDPHSCSLVVEAYHDITSSFYFEYFIGSDGQPVFLHSGDVRFRSRDNSAGAELVWVGLDLPASLHQPVLARALSLSNRVIDLVAKIGCRGHINIDAIVTADGEILFNESNLRWGGGTPLHSIGQRLLAPRISNDYSLSLVRDLICPPRGEVVRRLRDSSLHFNLVSNEGVIVLASDEYESGAAECLIIGETRARTREIEVALREVLAG